MEYKIINDMNENLAKEIASWQYEGDYEIYNMPDYQTMKNKGYSLCNPAKAKEFYCFLNENQQLVGYSRFILKDDKWVMGIGLSPKHVGHGLGSKIIDLSINEIRKINPNAKITLEVRSWNERAIKCYLKSGFEITKKEKVLDRTGKESEFIFMEL